MYPHESRPEEGVRGRVDLLQPLATQVVAIAHDANDRAGEVFDFAIRRQIDDAQVYTKRARRLAPVLLEPPGSA